VAPRPHGAGEGHRAIVVADGRNLHLFGLLIAAVVQEKDPEVVALRRRLASGRRCNSQQSNNQEQQMQVLFHGAKIHFLFDMPRKQYVSGRIKTGCFTLVLRLYYGISSIKSVKQA
jgi:hypothetical protein